MECNKDEAMRAKEIAQKKMQNNDFDGARKIALKAQKLFPELENISHLIAVCNVHCSAQSKLLGSDKDWYSILQVERLADDATIKKQYRKLALMLHPDKNKFPGAEAAFKLIGEAHLVLSDRGKRSLYDSKLGISIKSSQAKPPTQQVNKNSTARKQHMFQNNFPNRFSNPVNGLNQTTQSNPLSQECFWTCCPFCSIKYQYYRSYVNRALRCQKCSKPFIAYDIAAQGVPPRTNQSQAAAHGVPPSTNQTQAAAHGVPPSTNQTQAAAHGVPQSTNQSQAANQSVPPRSGWTQPSFSSGKEIPVPGSHKSGTKETAGFPASSSVSQGGASSTKVGFDPVTDMRNFVGSNFGTRNGTNSVGGKTEDVAASKVDTRPRAEANLSKMKRKRGKKMEAELTESCDTSSSSDSEEMIIGESVSDLPDCQNSEVNDFYERRRSSRQKHQVSYIESEGEGEDLGNLHKRAREGKSSAEKGEQEGINDAVADCNNPFKQKKSAPLKESLSEGNGSKNQTTEQAAGAPENGVKKVVEIIDDAESDAGSEDEQNPIVFHFPDPEFNDFDKDREENCFAVDQFWACYGNADGMPRYYAQIRKVYSTGFKLRIMWLEPDPDDENEINWVDSELPVGCGKFKRGGSQDTTDRLSFSHRVVCEKGSKRGSFFVYPRKGEIWALFKDWDIKWSTEPEKHENCKFEIVEVLSDFAENVGIKVALFDKVIGFVSLVHRRSESGVGEFVIPRKEIFRFSHRIPSVKMTGTERKGVPEGSFELDPASLPANPDSVCYPSMFKMDDKNLGAQGNSNLQDLPAVKNKLKMSETLSTPKKSDECNGKRASDEDSLLRRSPRGLNTANKEKKVNASHLPGQGVTADNSNSSAGRSCKAEGSSCQTEELDRQIHESSPRRSPRNSISLSQSASHDFSQDLFHDFRSERSNGKFAEGQIWVLYKPEDKLPKLYGQIRKVGYNPFVLHVALFEECSVTKRNIKHVCGSFKVQNGKLRTFEPSCFSHLLDAKVINKNRFEVYPKEGQVWALFKNWNPEMSSSDLENCGYDFVEIVDNSNGRIKASSLLHVKGYKSVFISPRIRSRAGLMDITESELGRFSHQIPAFRLTTERGGSLAGCWELDPAAVPPNVLPRK